MKNILLACILAGLAGHAAAQSFPTKPIRILVSSPPGSSPDLRARQIGAHLAESFGQQVIVENRPGANGLIAARETVRSGPDGYTLFLAIINNAIGDALKPDPCCRLNQELVPISRFTMTPLVMVVNASVDARSVKEFVALAKAKPDALTYGSGGPASISQLVGEWVKSEAGIKVLEVPYKGVNAEIPDLLRQPLTAFASERAGGEGFGDWCHRVGLEALKERYGDAVPDRQDRGVEIRRGVEGTIEFLDRPGTGVGILFLNYAAAPKDIVGDKQASLAQARRNQA